METKDRQTLKEESENSECFPLIETMSTWTQAGRHQRQETWTNSNEPSKTSVVTGSENRSKRWWWTGESRIEIPKDALIRDRFVASWTFPSLDEIYLQEREIEALPKQKNCTVSEFASSPLKKTEIKPEANRQQFSHPVPSVHSLNFFFQKKNKKKKTISREEWGDVWTYRNFSAEILWKSIRSCRTRWCTKLPTRASTHTHIERTRGNEDRKQGRGDAGSALRNRGRIWAETHFSTGSPRLVASSTDKQIVHFSFSGWKSFIDKFVGLVHQGKDTVVPFQVQQWGAE